VSTGRREFLVAGAALGISGLAGRTLLAAEAAKPEEDVSAVEDLMREHGVLRRILLVYDECLSRLRANLAVPSDALLRAAALVRKFVENYHEKLEENFLFPEFEKRDRLVPLVKVLREQHAAGRALTDAIVKHAAAKEIPPAAKSEIAKACRSFNRMYRPHAAREDTVLFPALRTILTAKQLDELGEKFEREEDRLFGGNGFRKGVEEVAAIERKLEIHDLAKFTPKVAKLAKE
jgi:hemerythrin-like domain-containing protein